MINKVTKLAFLKWLATRDNSETYSFVDNKDCFIARFLKSLFPNCSVCVWAAKFRVFDPKSNEEVQQLFYDSFNWLADVSVASKDAYHYDRDFYALGVRDRLEQKGFFNSLV
jgi:hypothetical protein